MKYVMLEVVPKGADAVAFKLPIMFPDKLVHRDVALAIRDVAKSTFKGAKVTIVSAGDAYLDDVKCSGKSESLDLTSRGERDSNVINWIDYRHGIEVEA